MAQDTRFVRATDPFERAVPTAKQFEPISEEFALQILQAHIRNALLKELGDEPQDLVVAIQRQTSLIVRSIFNEPEAYELVTWADSRDKVD